MEHVKPYAAPAYPVQPLSMPMPMPMPMPQPQPQHIMQTIYQPMTFPAPKPMPIIQKPVHTDIHLHSSYEQTTILLPPPKPVHKPVVVHSYSSTGAILVLFILLVIISRTYPRC
jgi:hypothetical protein